MPPKKSVKLSFVTSGKEKIEKKVDDYLFLPTSYNKGRGGEI